MIVRLTQLDGKLPNLALMRLSAWHRALGDEVHYYRTASRGLFEPAYDKVYGSAIFDFSAEKVARFRSEFPEAIVGGTGSGSSVTVEDIVPGQFTALDYSHWPAFTASLGFTQRGCRFNCGFCVVPAKEGKPQVAATIADIWRGEPWPKHLHLLDNDFFGQPKTAWKARLSEVREGGFDVCFNQGVNVRVVTDEIAAELASVRFRDNEFKVRRLYTAWDSLGDEALFMRGVDRLKAAGIGLSAVLAYMLVGYDPAETWADIFHRFDAMVARKIKPYPMIYGDRTRRPPPGGLAVPPHLRLMDFQRWVVTAIYRKVAFADYGIVPAPAADSAQLEMAL